MLFSLGIQDADVTFTSHQLGFASGQIKVGIQFDLDRFLALHELIVLLITHQLVAKHDHEI